MYICISIRIEGLNMLGVFISQLPFSVCVVWLILVLFRGHKSYSNRLFLWIMVLLAVSFWAQ